MTDIGIQGKGAGPAGTAGKSGGSSPSVNQRPPAKEPPPARPRPRPGFCQHFRAFGIDDEVCMRSYPPRMRPPDTGWLRVGPRTTWFPCSKWPADSCQNAGQGRLENTRTHGKRACECAAQFEETPSWHPYHRAFPLEGRPGASPYALAHVPGARQSGHRVLE